MITSEVIVGQGFDLRGFSWWFEGAAFEGYLAPNSIFSGPDARQGYCKYPVQGNPPCKGAPSILSITNAARSRHPGGVNVGMGDGSVRFVKNSINLADLASPEHHPGRRGRQQRRLLSGESTLARSGLRIVALIDPMIAARAARRPIARPGHGPPHPAAVDLASLAAECDFRTTRRSGPGGQNRNKVETAVILTHRPTRHQRRGRRMAHPGRESPQGPVPAPAQAGPRDDGSRPADRRRNPTDPATSGAADAAAAGSS